MQQERQNSIRKFDRDLEGQATLNAELQSTQEELEEKRNRVEKTRKDIASKNFDEKLQDKADKLRLCEEKREALLKENQTLNMQAESRANLNLKRTEVKTKTTEIQSTYVVALVPSFNANPCVVGLNKSPPSLKI